MRIMNLSKVITVCLVTGALTAHAVLAGEWGNFRKYYSDEFFSCIDNVGAPGIVAMCMDRELKRQDRKLNLAYRKLMQCLPEERRDELKSIQRLWIKYRDKKCSFYYHKNSGSGGLADMGQCQLDETIRRTIELEELSCQ